MAIKVVRVQRIGQISGATALATPTNPPWPNLVDPVGNPLLTDTGRWWNAIGFDKGANTEYSPDDGVTSRLYIFSGDVATDQQHEDTTPQNSDLVAWVDEPTPLRNGGHLAMGENFQLPIIGPEPLEWQFCVKCSALFWNGDANFKGHCSLGGAHEAAGDNFSLPTEPTGIQGQPQWYRCDNCYSLFWNGDGSNGVCPAGVGISHSKGSSEFVIPVTPSSLGGQSDWRFCGNCHGLFFDGFPSKGICVGSPGGGIHINVVTQPNGQFDPFRGPGPIGYLGANETPNGAFSYDGRMYVCAGFTLPQYNKGLKRLGDPQPGQYLFSKADPSQSGEYETEFMLSPKLGWCARDESRTTFESHLPLGYHFLLRRDVAQGLKSGFRCCRNCEAVYFAGDAPSSGVCQRGGTHVPDLSIPPGLNTPDVFSLEFSSQNQSGWVGPPEDVQNQANWKQCSNCFALYYFDANSNDTGLCPASGGQHVSTGEDFRVPHDSIEPYKIGQPDWRFCHKCNSLFWNGDGGNGFCAQGGQHEAAGFNFQVPFTTGPVGPPDQSWRYCVNCASLFYQGAGGVCPNPTVHQGPHKADGWYFSLPENQPTSVEWQGNWFQCSNCAGLFFDGDNGCCPATGFKHIRLSDRVYELPHNPGADANTRDQLRFCIRCHGLVRSDQPVRFVWTSPTVVSNQDHPKLPPCPEEKGVVMISYDWKNFRLSWMPVTPGQSPRFDSIKYFHAGTQSWTDDIYGASEPGYELFAHPFPGQYTDVSASWLKEPGCWVVLYGTAGDPTQKGQSPPDLPIMARFSPDLLTWSEPVPLFDPGNRDVAYGVWMHDPAMGDPIYPDIPPSPPANDPTNDHKSWAYGAFLIDRYTTWDPQSRELNLTYLMSTSYPYQVQLMETAVRLPSQPEQQGSLLFYYERFGMGFTAVVDTNGAYRDVPSQDNLTLVFEGRSWTHVVGTPGGGVLFYSSEDGIGGTAVVDSNGIFSGFTITDYFFGHWKYVTSVGQNGLFFYNYIDELAEGVAKTALLDGSGNFTWGDYIPGFGQWTHVVGCPNGALLFYNRNSETGATATVDDNGEYDFAGVIDDDDLFAGATHIAAVGAGSLIFYNAETTDGAGATATIDDDGVFTPVENNLTTLGLEEGSQPEPWTNVVGLPNGCVFFYTTTTTPAFGATAVVDENGHYTPVRTVPYLGPSTLITACGIGPNKQS